MKNYLRITTIIATAAFSLFGFFTFPIRATAQAAPAHHDMHGKPTSEKAAAVTNSPAMNDRVDAETQLPPGTVGINWPEPVEDHMRFHSLLVNQLEYQMNEGDDTLGWEAVGWYGGDYNRLWLKTEGEWRTTGERGGEAEVQALYGRLIAPFWDFQAGLRYDQYSGEGFDRSRGFAVIGLQGLAPHRFEVEPALFISQDGDISTRITTTYDLLLTQRLILQPRLDFDAAVQSAEEFGVGEGVNSLGMGLRLRYEIMREVAPYIGVQWLNRFGETADISRRDGGDADEITAVFGVRLWF
ncbi:MAG TPA: copper resistance protein B [Kiritimatiellia bacterium]|nr:copper resistance protein B [Kiritimatiellia bacterium]